MAEVVSKSIQPLVGCKSVNICLPTAFVYYQVHQCCPCLDPCRQDVAISINFTYKVVVREVKYVPLDPTILAACSCLRTNPSLHQPYTRATSNWSSSSSSLSLSVDVVRHCAIWTALQVQRDVNYYFRIEYCATRWSRTRRTFVLLDLLSIFRAAQFWFLEFRTKSTKLPVVVLVQCTMYHCTMSCTSSYK